MTTQPTDQPADEEIAKIVSHLIVLHSPDPTFDHGLCIACMLDSPCHTRVDLEKILDLLGANHN